MKYAEQIKFILGLLPMIIEAIKAIEAAIPGEGNGEKKLGLVRAILEGAYQAGDAGSVGDFNSVWPAIARTVSAAVALLNSTGAFKTKTAGAVTN